MTGAKMISAPHDSQFIYLEEFESAAVDHAEAVDDATVLTFHFPALSAPNHCDKCGQDCF